MDAALRSTAKRLATLAVLVSSAPTPPESRTLGVVRFHSASLRPARRARSRTLATNTFCAAIQLRQHALGIARLPGRSVRRHFFQVRSREWLQREAGLIEHTGQRAADGPQRAIQNTADLLTQCGAVFAGIFHRAARIRVGVSAAA